MKKTVLLIAVVFTLAANAFAHPVSTAWASFVAANFWAAHRPANLRADVSPKALTFPELDQLYIFDMEGLGFVIVPADDRVMPVLAYSFEDPFPTELHPELAYWLHGYNDQLASLAKDDSYPQRESIMQQWGKLLLYDVLKDASDDSTTSDLTAVPAMLVTKWDQGDPYNIYCPYDSVRHGRTVVGCVATAMAQIMKYWNYPSFGRDTHSYQPRSMWHSGTVSPTLSVDFANTTYLWQLMPRRASLGSTDVQKDAVATLSYHCGVAVDMMYGVSADGGSGAYSYCGPWTSACATNAFSHYFKYDTTLFFASRANYSDNDWRAMIDENLALGQPMYYDGSDSTGGHAFVLDGSDLEDRYHFNWGWDGYGNGFYTVDNLAPGSGGYGGNATYTFNQGQGAIFGIRPGEVETFDTVDYYDSICNNSTYIHFREYTLRVAAMDTLLRHLDTIFNYHLKIISQKQVFLNSNIPNTDPTTIRYCPATGFTFPECPFEKENSMFIGWCRNALGDDTIFAVGQTIHIKSAAAFFALWLDDVSIDEVSEDKVQLWPNPSTGEVIITLPFHNASISVIDAVGRTVLREDYPNMMGGTAKITLNDLPAGTYTVQIRASTGIYNRRIIKLK